MANKYRIGSNKKKKEERESSNSRGYGETDEIITPGRSVELAAAFPDAVVRTHPGGHVIPAAMRKPVKAFLQSVAPGAELAAA